MVIIGFDPGLTGGCAVLDHNGLRAVFDMPLIKIPNVGPKAHIQNKIDGRALVKLLRQHVKADDSVRSVIEGVNVMGGTDNAIQAQGSLMRSLGTIETVLELLNFAPSYANPITWKRFFGLIEAKQTATQRKRKASDCARRLYPNCAEITRAKDHNRCEAILLAHFFMRTVA